MNRSGILIIFIFISLILHGLFIFFIVPDSKVVQPEPVPQTVSVGFRIKVETPQQEPHPEAAAQDEVEAQAVLAQEPIPASIPEPEPEPEPEQQSEIVSEEHQAPTLDDKVHPSADTVESASEVQDDVQLPPAGNPFSELIKRINSLKNSTYPLKAKKRGYQGTVIVEVHLDTDGKLISTKIIQKCRYSILDNAALELIARVLEQAYPHHTGKEVILRIPITYRLGQ